jgi:hypothetical protein
VILLVIARCHPSLDAEIFARLLVVNHARAAGSGKLIGQRFRVGGGQPAFDCGRDVGEAARPLGITDFAGAAIRLHIGGDATGDCALAGGVDFGARHLRVETGAITQIRVGAGLRRRHLAHIGRAQHCASAVEINYQTWWSCFRGNVRRENHRGRRARAVAHESCRSDR